ncbi:hypothetical protein C1645_829849 [Glomus cerebriforme]|uniref:Uncharacterized protein n=1 Tax=Glomus cerebriforme TaxID=658196 RepID=A0A397SJ64_9GLOM|nr:hypothetical protein C1645_829849 [Glomus cerebriforme]
MDSILKISANSVDAHTARYIMNQCILNPLMKGGTRILVTHHLAIKCGKISVSSTISKLCDSGLLNLILEEDDSSCEYKLFSRVT